MTMNNPKLMTAPGIDVLKQWFRDHYEETLKDFFTFLSFPSISADSHFEKDCRKTADWLVAYMNQMGLSATLWETSGLPVVFGAHMDAGPDKPTLLLYHH